MIKGRAWKFGDDVNTDVIMPGKYLAMRNPVEIAPYIMEGDDPDFGKKAKPGDLIVSGELRLALPGDRAGRLKAFASGGHRPTFARIFRSAVNIGLPVLECPAAAADIREGDVVTVDMVTGRITNETTGLNYQAAPFPPFLQELIAAGGLVNYARRRLGWA
jgi:3-isopropylmalate dehydratase small subunit